MGSGFSEYEEIITAESIANTVVLAGTRAGAATAAYIKQGQTTIMGPDEPLFLRGSYEEELMVDVNDTDNWSRGDPKRLEIRDMAYIWHLHNDRSEYAMMAVPAHRVIWLTGGPPAKGPFIPFKIDDPYIHQDFQDLTYYKSLKSDPYSLEEIARIEDAIMAPDGNVIGEIREIQRCIAKRLPLPPPEDGSPTPSPSPSPSPEQRHDGSSASESEPPHQTAAAHLDGGCAVDACRSGDQAPWGLYLALLVVTHRMRRVRTKNR
jgi:hypothetical protein